LEYFFADSLLIQAAASEVDKQHGSGVSVDHPASPSLPTTMASF